MSNFLRLDYKDVLKSAIVTIIALLLQSVLDILNQNRIPSVEEISSIGWVAIISGVSYLVKNIFTNSNGELFHKEIKEPE